MPRLRYLQPGLLAACLLASACSSPGASAPAASTPGASAFSEPATGASSEPTTDPSVVIVRGIHNIFGAGHDRAPDPGGGGGGQKPDAWPLPSGATRIVTFPSATGEVNSIVDLVDYNGPGGDMSGDTDIESYGGISGIVHHSNGMFLVGVFLTDDEPADPAPPRLDFTNNEDFDLLEPEIGQIFLIGDGVGHRYLAPTEATRLFLGFADAARYKGSPGYYGNNSGGLEVIVDVATE